VLHDHPIRLVLFDVGSTLVDPHPSAQELVLRVLQRHGLAVDPQMLSEAEPRAWKEVAHLLPFQRYGQEESRAFWDAFYSALIGHLGHAPEATVQGALYEEFQRLENWRLYPDAVPTLQELRSRGFRLGVVSNWEEWLENLLLALEIHPLFDIIVASGPFGRAKPHPSIFEHALELGGVTAAEAVHVGDNPRDDIEGARAAGLRPILIDRRDRHAAIEIERIRALDELLGLLGRR
jgi:putative hydrolase of the HAD superfamily